MFTYNIRLEKNDDTPLYRQLADKIQALVAKGEILPDTKLPSIRQMAQNLDVNNTTVINAYKYLERKMAVYSVIGSGTFISKPPTRLPQKAEVVAQGYINFADTTTDGTLFPVTAFRRAFDAVLERDGGQAFGYHDAQGYKPLRESFSKIIEGVSPDCIQVISDTHQAIETLADTLLGSGDVVFVEELTPQGAVAAFLSRQAKIVHMPMAGSGLDFEALESLIKKHKPKLIYVMPHFQTPTAISYSETDKKRLLELAGAANTYIIEVDLFSDFYYDGIKRTPLKTLDEADKVIYVKSFSKTLMPGMGFIASPIEIAADIAPADLATSGYIQRGFDLFLRSGAYDLHLANMRTVYGRRYQKIIGVINTYLANLADVILPAGGLSLWIKPHNKIADYIDKFLQRKVVVSPSDLYVGSGEGFRVSFAAVNEEQINEGIGAIAAVLNGEELETSQE
ncbi:MAG: PLP-dependent aminotransferase family protein [Defluviitaleaceae bacterium]|nr:PLP-dependent aminotransferase family protein [Defluviitaleaceae bacterium]